MPTIEKLQPQSAPQLGRECRFALVGDAPMDAEFFLEHQGILYPDPLATRGADGSVCLYLEVPGLYRLHANWSSGSGERRCSSIEFEVGGQYLGWPQNVKIDRDVSLWAPSNWEGQLLNTHEAAVFRELADVVVPGAVVYDIGANVGLFAVRFASAVGAKGHLYAFEPNPICVSYLRANLQQARRVELHDPPGGDRQDTGGLRVCDQLRQQPAGCRARIALCRQARPSHQSWRRQPRPADPHAESPPAGSHQARRRGRRGRGRGRHDGDSGGGKTDADARAPRTDAGAEIPSTSWRR